MKRAGLTCAVLLGLTSWLVHGVPEGVAALLPGADACAAADTTDEKWGPFRGSVVDVDTGRPIAGAAAFAVWFQAEPAPLHMTEKFFDARVAVTDNDGRFEFAERERPFFGFRIMPPYLDYVAPGYVRWNVVTLDDGFSVAQMRRESSLSVEERLSHSSVTLGRIPLERLADLKRAIDAERARMGLDPIRSIRGEP